jgi:uncharacterized protein YjdB
MFHIYAPINRGVRASMLFLLMPVVAVCSASESTTTADAPGTVSDLSVASVNETSATLTFTQVDDGTGQPASYDVRYAPGSISWGSATVVSNGTCHTPLSGAASGANLTCTVEGLSPATSYDFQLLAFRGTLNSNAVFGHTSNVATASTTATNPPAPVVTTVTVEPTTASVAVGATTALQATVRDAQGNPMSGQAVSWSTGNASAATVNSVGVVSGIATGSATISATSSGKIGSAAVTVTAAPPPPQVVTTVTVSPTSESIAVGASTTLSATVKDAQGNVMTGQTISWSTSNAGAATVNSSGVVTGVSAGSATITATTSGKSGTSSITVTAPPPPPPPPSGTLLFQEDFETANLAARGWYDNTGSLLNTTEHVAGSTRSAQYRFTAGSTGPTSGGAQRHKFTPSTSVYISFYVKYSANWVGSRQSYQPHEFYVLSTLDDEYDGLSENFMTLYLEHNYQNGGKPVMALQDNKSINHSYGSLPRNLVGVTENRSTAGCNGMAETNMYSECFDFGSFWYNNKQLLGPVVFQPSAGPGYKNNWNFVEAYYQLNTIVNGIGQKDGVMQYWFNGTLIIDRHDILFRTGARPTLQLNQFIIAPYIGDGSPVDQSMFIDNLRVGTGRLP